MIYRCFFWLACYFSLNVAAFCNPIVQINSSLGDFKIELFDEVASVTVNNFLNYVESKRYNGTLIHRSVPSFVIQGGWLSFQSEINALVSIKTDDPIINEFRMSNIRGTVSMAKQGGNPNSATSQWFVNLSNNTANLDGQNGGFTVFGRIVGNGMAIVDQMAKVNTYTLDGIPNFPLSNYSQGPLSSNNFVTISNVELLTPELALNYFDSKSSELRLTLDAGSAGIATLALSVETAEPAVIFKLVLSSIQWLDDPVEGMATFNPATGSIFIPELSVGGVAAYKNLEFYLRDSENLLFVLSSYEEI